MRGGAHFSAMDTRFGSESQSYRVASSSVSVGPKKRETYRQRVLRFAPTHLVAEVLCPEAIAIADMEAEISKRISTCMLTLRRLDVFWIHSDRHRFLW